MTSRLLGLVVSICFCGAALDTAARQDDTRLDSLFHELHVTDDSDQADNIERTIWEIWTDSGRDDVNALMRQGIEAMSLRRYDEALEAFDDVIELDPDFAEGWNKRATVYWLMDRNANSVEDIQRTLALEPRHFGAIAGMGLILFEQGDKAGALRAFEEVLKINPHAEGAVLRIQQLQELIQDESV